jgi:predicted phosphoribosyltransferase
MIPNLRFTCRADAGRALAPRVLEFTESPSMVLGVPHGGVEVAKPIAELLGATLAPVWVKKLYSPHMPDVVIGAVDVDGDVTLSPEVALAEGLSDEDIGEIGYHAHQILLREWEGGPGPEASSLLPGVTAVVVDDCMTTGLTLRSAMRWVRRQLPRRVVLAVPVVDRRIWHRVAGDADCAITLEERDDGPLARSEIYDQYTRVTPDQMSALFGS